MTGRGNDLAPAAGFLAAPPTSDAVERLYDGDRAGLGYVMNASVLWAQQPQLHDGIVTLIGAAAEAGGLTVRQRGVLITACASTLGDSYCALAWGNKLADEADADLAGGVLRGDDSRLDAAEQALARWARKVTANPNATTHDDVQVLRDAGFDDAQIFAITVFVGARLAFSTVNDALGARPDAALGTEVPRSVRDAVTFGRAGR